MADIDREISHMEGERALPRDNGELLFEAPWEARAFALAVALNQSGLYPWRDFSSELAHQISAGEKAGAPQAYYRAWLHSLEALLQKKGLVKPEEMQSRAEAVAHTDDHEH